MGVAHQEVDRAAQVIAVNRSYALVAASEIPGERQPFFSLAEQFDDARERLLL